MAYNDSPPPYSEALEQSILGAVLTDTRALDKAMALNLEERDFYLERHKVVWRAISALQAASITVDMMSVHEQIHSTYGNEQWISVSGNGISIDLVKFTQAADDIRIAHNIVLHAETLRNYRIRREIAEFSVKTLQSIGQPDSNALDALQTLEQDVFHVSSLRFRRKQPTMRETAASAWKLVEKRFNGEFNGVRTGLKTLDRRIDGGLENGRFYVMGARPGVGKSTLAGVIARNVSLEQDAHVVIATYEMTKEQYMLRLATSLAKDDWRHLTPAGLGAFAEHVQTLANAKMLILDDSAATPLELRSQIETLKRTHGTALLVVDYIQLIPPNIRNARKDIEIGEISHALKALAKKCDIPVLAISSLNRKLEERTDQRPRLSDFRESGDIESDADVVLGLFREDEHPATMSIRILKNRDGCMDDMRLGYNPEYYILNDIDSW